METIPKTNQDLGNLFMKYIGDVVNRAVEDSVARVMANYQPRPVEPEAPKYYSRKDVCISSCCLNLK